MIGSMLKTIMENSLQAFVRRQSIAKRRALSRIEAEILFPNGTKKATRIYKLRP